MKTYWSLMEVIKLENDRGADSTANLWGGKFLSESAWDTIVSPSVDTCIMKPNASLYDGEPLAYVVCDVYPDDEVFECLKTIVDTTTMRANASGPILKEDMDALARIVVVSTIVLRHSKTSSSGYTSQTT
jgi:hypothetical protein